MRSIQVLGKFLDQPMLVSKFQKAVPALLTAGACAYTMYDASKEKDTEKRKQRALKTGITLGVTVASALAAPYIASAVTKRPLNPSLKNIKLRNADLVDSFIKSSNIDEKTASILQKSKEKVLSFSEIKSVFKNLKDKKGSKQFLEKLIPSPENINAKDIFSEIGFLSVNGAIPVVGGIAGGIFADRLTDKEYWKDKVPDKIKEGSYQYLANIFLCNVGAGLALAGLEKMGVNSKIGRAVGMTAGIIAMGVVGGSKIANFIGEKVIEPLCHKKDKSHTHSTNVLDIKLQEHIKYNHKPHKHQKRKPELLDIGLHVDDVATVSLLSGLKWIEPALPVMYTISGYRAGIGYRN
ncbi:MAG: hypothetical protein E7Z90_07140 [Cyanobacteria bacterium SIG29]|nr:hypothetical protein [Cyanobacteria bacterium SIG29]